MKTSIIESSVSTIDGILKKINLEEFRDIIKNNLERIGSEKYTYENQDEYLDALDHTFNIHIRNPKPKSMNYDYLDRIYCSPCFYTDANYLDAIRLTNELSDKIEKDWFDIFEIVLKESGLIYTRVRGYSIETNQEKLLDMFSYKGVFSSKTNYPYYESDVIPF